MNVRLKHDLPFAAGFYYNNSLRMNNYSLRLWMTTNTENPVDHSVSFERIKYFIYNQIDSTIFINHDQIDQCALLTQAGLDVTTIPGDPVDQLIGIMLYYKLNAIMEDRMIIVETELSSTHGEHMTYLHSEHENILGFAQPAWWATADLTHSDFAPANLDNVVAISQSTVWRDLDLAWDDQPVEHDPGNVVVFANFKPANETE
jgi:hypothetical protein